MEVESKKFNRNDEFVKEYRKLGLNVFPCKPKSKEPKIPWKQYQDKKYDGPFEPDDNLAIVCGKSSNNLVVIDIDSPELFPGFENLKEKTRIHKTGKGGYHIFGTTNSEKLPPTMRLDNDKGQHVDIQSQGSYVVVPPSIHPNGNRYSVISGVRTVAKIGFSEILQSLKELGFNTNQAHKPVNEIVKGVSQGSRNDSAFKYACLLLDTKKLDKDTTLYELKKWNETNNPPLPESELKTVFESAVEHVEENPIKQTVEGAKNIKELYDFAKRKIKKTIISKSDSNQIFAKIENNKHIETIDLNSAKARSWLLYNYKQETKKLGSAESYKNALEGIKGDALFDSSNKEIIYTRIAQINNAIYYDLCSPKWEIVKITKDTIEIIPHSESSPTFVRTQSMNEQVKSRFESRKALEELVNLLRIKDDKLVFIIHLISFFFEQYQSPIMVIQGEHGSIKTTITKTVKRIVDPSASNISSLPIRKDDIPLGFSRKYLSVFDNVSELKQNVSDMFCRAITGEETSKRQLYTDADEYIFQYKRKIILNGIAPKIESPDFNDRAIFYETSQIPDNEMLTEEEFNQKLDELLPHILGEIFDVLSKTMKRYNEIGKDIKPFSRMGEFEKYGETISRLLGYKDNEFLADYKEKWKLSSTNAIEAYPIVNLIRDLIKDVKHFEDSVANLHKELKNRAKEAEIETKGKESGFPSRPNRLSSQLKLLNPLFRKLGYDITIKQYTLSDGKYPKNNKIVYITNNNVSEQKQNTLSKPEQEKLDKIP